MPWRSSRGIQSGSRWFDWVQRRAIGRWAALLDAETAKAARRMIERRHGAGIEITLVSAGGEVELVHAWGTGSYYGLPYAV